MENKIQFTDEDGEVIDFFIVEQTRINAQNYILVTDSDDEEEADAYIMKDVSSDEDSEAMYVMVEDDEEIESLSKVFAELLGEDEELV